MKRSPMRSKVLAAPAAVLLAGGLALVACSDEPMGTPRRPTINSDAGVVGDGSSSGAAAAEVLFRAVEPQLTRSCGGGGGACHVEGTYPGSPARFLAGPDAYASIRAAPGVITKDVTESSILKRGQHAGPAISADPDFEKKVTAWLEAESAVLQSVKLPSTDAVSIVSGANDIDLSKAASTPVGPVHLKFDASSLSGILSLANVRLAVPAGSAVHIYKPRFVLVRDGQDVPDPADSFSNADQTVAGGTETRVSPGSALFAGAGWTPFDFAKDKLRIEVEKLEPGTVTVISTPTACANVAGFAANVLPTLRTTMATNGTCQSCHGGGTQPSLGGNDNAAICIGILQRLEKGNIAQSKMITKVTQAGHPGGTVANAATWTALFVNNAGVFF